MRRRFVTPEGVDLDLELGTAGARAGAFALDLVIMLAVLIGASLALAYALGNDGRRFELIGVLWLLGAFVLRNGWFTLFEMSGRGATPGKRVVGLRVVARDGDRLTGGAVIARNAMREVEVFLPLSFLGFQTAEGAANTFLVVFALGWTGIFLFFPLFNRDRLRLGDIVAGTWVVRRGKATLGDELIAARPARAFSDAALDLYGEYELQALENVLRNGTEDGVATVAYMIRAKAGLPFDGEDDRAFLRDYYAALCARLERGIAFGRRVEDKHARAARR